MHKFINLFFCFLVFTISLNTSCIAAEAIDSAGWIDVPLNDTQPFDKTAEYRVYRDDGPYEGNKDYIYPTVVKEDDLRFAIVNECSKGFSYIQANNKSVLYNDCGSKAAKPTKIQKRLSPIPKNMISIFASDTCPQGWTITGKYDGNTILCKKD